MGKASSSKKVARAARTGGGRTKRGGSRSWLFPGFMSLVVVLGTFLVFTSRNDLAPDLSRPRPPGGPGNPGDHWHAAIGFDICGAFAPPIQDQTDPLGIHTHGDGVVHVHPFSSVSAGNRARLKVFMDAVKAEVTNEEIRLPGQEARKNGDKCGEQSGEVRVKVWNSRDPSDQGQIWAGDPGDIRLRDNQLITVAFKPKDADISRPPTADELDRLTDLGPTIPPTVPGTPTSEPVTAPTAPVDPNATTVPPTPPDPTATTAAPPPPPPPPSP